MPTDGSSDNSESNRAIMGFEAILWAAADKLRNNVDGNEERKKQIQLLGLNLGIAATNIIAFVLIGLKFFGAGRLETALSGTIIVLSGAGLTYGNYKILTGKEIIIPPPEWTLEYCIAALNNHRGLKTFEETIDLLLDQIVRLQKRNKTIRDILHQFFSGSEISYQKFDAVIADVEKIFVKNIRSINNKLNAFDEEDYISLRERYEAGKISKQVMVEKFKVYGEYITFVKDATEYNEQILLKLDKLLLVISGLDCIEPGQLEKMPEMIEIDILLEEAVNYKN
jgi:hypothetical protein